MQSIINLYRPNGPPHLTLNVTVYRRRGERFLRRFCPLAATLGFKYRAVKVNMRLEASFLGAFTKLGKATISFMFVRLSVRMGQLGSHWADFREI
jgi:hypothetical protein